MTLLSLLRGELGFYHSFKNLPRDMSTVKAALSVIQFFSNEFLLEWYTCILCSFFCKQLICTNFWHKIQKHCIVFDLFYCCTKYYHCSYCKLLISSIAYCIVFISQLMISFINKILNPFNPSYYVKVFVYSLNFFLSDCLLYYLTCDQTLNIGILHISNSHLGP